MKHMHMRELFVIDESLRGADFRLSRRITLQISFVYGFSNGLSHSGEP
jgi:hypothetical protein